jgi:hypothetical protein
MSLTRDLFPEYISNSIAKRHIKLWRNDKKNPYKIDISQKKIYKWPKSI